MLFTYLNFGDARFIRLFQWQLHDQMLLQLLCLAELSLLSRSEVLVFAKGGW
jgi:hypothetical protein